MKTKGDFSVRFEAMLPGAIQAIREEAEEVLSGGAEQQLEKVEDEQKFDALCVDVMGAAMLNAGNRLLEKR